MKTIEERIAKWKFREGHIGAFVVRIEDAEEIAEEYAEEHTLAFVEWMAKEEGGKFARKDIKQWIAEFKESLKK